MSANDDAPLLEKDRRLIEINRRLCDISALAQKIAEAETDAENDELVRSSFRVIAEAIDRQTDEIDKLLSS